MKKIAFLLAAVAFMTAANAQVMVGIQGGYHWQKNTQSYDTENYTQSCNWLGGLQLGYLVTPRLYIGVAGNYQDFTADTFYLHSPISFEGMPRVVDNRTLSMHRTNWTVAPQVKWEFLKYGNMHFHLLLQGNVSSWSYTSYDESFNTPFRNSGEYLEMPNIQDSIKAFSWGVSLRPTLTYEFSRHLSAELSLDFLSVGYVDYKTTDDHLVEKYDNEGDLEYLDGDIVYTTTSHRTRTLYAGLNTLMDVLRWESPMLRLGFNWTF
ncbi:MAG: hypothetical protein IK058_01835 [Bacteroidales bacterium]|nr:hypothetical protein [Bacteroidales bacterium]